MSKISVVMSVYNGEKYLSEAIKSVLTQDFSDFEFIIIDDGSTDKSLAIIKSFIDNRIRLISRENKGLIYSLNEGIGLAQGEYIARLDADDICLPNRFSKQLAVLENKKIALVGSWAIKIDDLGRETGIMDYPPQGNREIKRFFIKHNPFIHSSIMIRRDVFAAVGLYKNSFKHAEDYELWSRVLAKFQAANITEPLIKYRITSDSITREHNKLMRYQGFRVRALGFFRFIFARS